MFNDLWNDDGLHLGNLHINSEIRMFSILKSTVLRDHELERHLV